MHLTTTDYLMSSETKLKNGLTGSEEGRGGASGVSDDSRRPTGSSRAATLVAAEAGGCGLERAARLERGSEGFWLLFSGLSRGLRRRVC